MTREHERPMRTLARKTSPTARLELERLEGMPRWQPDSPDPEPERTRTQQRKENP